MKPFYPIRGVLAYYSPQTAHEKGIAWREPPHVHFANLILNLKSLLAFDHGYGALLHEHWRMTSELRAILEKAPNLTEEERQRWAAANRKFEITVSDADVQIAEAMQSLLREAWKGEKLAVQVIQHGGDLRHAQDEAFGPPRLTVAPSSKGIVIYAKDLWNFIRVAFLLDYERGRTKVCGNPECFLPYFLARRKDQKFCERGECTAYAQRRYALAWWNVEGIKRRREKQRHKQTNSTARRRKRRVRR